MSISSSSPLSQRKISAPTAPEVQKAEQAKKPEAPLSAKAQPPADTQVTAKANEASSTAPRAAAVGALQTATIDRPVQKLPGTNPLTAPASTPNPFASKKESPGSIESTTNAPPPTGTVQAFSNNQGSSASATSEQKGEKKPIPEGIPEMGLPVVTLPDGPSRGRGDLLTPGSGAQTVTDAAIAAGFIAPPESSQSTQLVSDAARTARPGFDQGSGRGLSAAEQAALMQAGQFVGGNPVTGLTSQGIGGQLGADAASGLQGLPGSGGAVNSGLVASTFENAVVGGLSVYSADKAAAALIGFGESQAAKYAVAKGAETGLVALYGGSAEAVAGAGAAGIGSAAAAVAAAGAAGVIFGTVVNLAFNKVSGTTLGDILSDATGLDVGAYEKEQTAKAAEAAAARKASEEAAAAKKAAEDAAAAEKAKTTGGGTTKPAPEGEGRRFEDRFGVLNSPAHQQQLAALGAGRRNQDVTPAPENQAVDRSVVVPSASQTQQNLVGQPAGAGVTGGGSIQTGPDYNGTAGAIDLGRDAVQTTSGGRTEDPADFMAGGGPPPGPGLPPQSDSSSESAPIVVDLPRNPGQNQSVRPGTAIFGN